VSLTCDIELSLLRLLMLGIDYRWITNGYDFGDSNSDYWLEKK
jgi:hypothetical protein